MNDLNSKVVARIKQIRLAQGSTQKAIANTLNLSSNAYSRIENGNTQLTINNLEVISEVLGISVSKLLEGDAGKTVVLKNAEIMEKMGGGILLSTNQFKQLCLLLQKTEM